MVRISKHAKQRLAERGIATHHVAIAIQKPVDKWKGRGDTMVFLGREGLMVVIDPYRMTLVTAFFCHDTAVLTAV